MNNEKINTIMIMARHLREVISNTKQIDEAYDWFVKAADAAQLTESERFRVVFLSGSEDLEKLVAESTFPWLPVVIRKSPTFQVTKAIAAFAVTSKVPTMPSLPVPSAECLRDARKSCGVFPYDGSGNYLAGDPYFARGCAKMYGQKMWDYACSLVRKPND